MQNQAFNFRWLQFAHQYENARTVQIAMQKLQENKYTIKGYLH